MIKTHLQSDLPSPSRSSCDTGQLLLLNKFSCPSASHLSYTIPDRGICNLQFDQTPCCELTLLLVQSNSWNLILATCPLQRMHCGSSSVLCASVHENGAFITHPALCLLRRNTLVFFQSHCSWARLMASFEKWQGHSILTAAFLYFPSEITFPPRNIRHNTILYSYWLCQ